MHPHWHATDDSDEGETVPVSVDSVSAAPAPAAKQSAMIRTASRKPAAVVGILLAGAFGYAAFLGNGGLLPGQVSDSAMLNLRLTEKGAIPAALNVAPGMTINVVNEDTIPHVLSFASLSVDGKPLETSPIFPGSKIQVLFPATVPLGTYAYVSKTSELSGEIVIKNLAASSIPASSAAAVPQKSSASAVFPSTTQQQNSSVSSASAKAATAVLPINFHTVGNPQQRPVEPLHTGAPLAAVTQHKPIANTASGPATWILVFATTALVLGVTRKAFR